MLVHIEPWMNVRRKPYLPRSTGEPLASCSAGTTRAAREALGCGAMTSCRALLWQHEDRPMLRMSPSLPRLSPSRLLISIVALMLALLQQTYSAQSQNRVQTFTLPNGG